LHQRIQYAVEASALTHAGSVGIHGRSPMLRLQSDERLVAIARRGNQHAFEALVARYQARLLAFCRHMLGSREDAEDVLQEVFAAAYNAMLADERAINVRPWLYRIARNRSLNHLRRTQAIGVDSMDVHLSEYGQTTADKVHKREEFRQLVGDVQDLPETQRTALLLREIDALSYDQIAEAMETTVPSVKSLLVRARVSLAEAAEARLLSCEEVRLELGEVAEGLKRTTAPVRRHLRTCEKCQGFRKQLRQTNKALAAVMPVAPLLIFKKVILAHLGSSAAAGGGGAAAAGGGAAASGAAAGGAAASVAAGGAMQATMSVVATKAAAGLAAAAIVTAGAVEAKHVAEKPRASRNVASAPPFQVAQVPPAAAPVAAPVAVESAPQPVASDTPKPAKRPVAKPVPTATPAPAPTATPTATPDAVQKVVDTTALPTEITGSTLNSAAALPTAGEPQAQPQPQPEPQSEPAQEPQGDPQQPPPADPQPEPEPASEPEPQPTQEPQPEPSPEPRDDDGPPEEETQP
jgi:RNA polymerase sigma factor (sigma-70 family)